MQSDDHAADEVIKVSRVEWFIKNLSLMLKIANFFPVRVFPLLILTIKKLLFLSIQIPAAMGILHLCEAI